MKEFTINYNKTIKDALIKIDNNAMGTLFVIKNNRVIGVLTDGDIRRSLINNMQIKSSVCKIMNKKFVKIRQNEDKNKVIEKLNRFNHKIKVFPVINNDKKLVDITTQERFNYVPIYEPTLKGNEMKYLIDCISTNWISSAGPYVRKFEDNFSLMHYKKRALSVSSGTTGLHIALAALGVKKGDEVIVPNFTFAAAINSILYVNATPVIVDVDKDKWTIEINEIKKNITKKTKAIIAVHIYGNPCDLDQIVMICKKQKIFLIEDCAEAIGSKYKNKFVGTFGDCGVFSFFANKTISTGEGGMVIFKDEKKYNHAKILRDHGMSTKNKYFHDFVGFNYRMTNIQAAIGLAQLENFKKIIKRKIEIAKIYKEKLKKNKNIIFQRDEKKSVNTFWAVGVLAKYKSFSYPDFEKKMKKSGVEVRNFFFPLNLQKIYKKYANKRKFNTDGFFSAGISLPTFASIKISEINYICKALIKNLK